MRLFSACVSLTVTWGFGLVKKTCDVHTCCWRFGSVTVIILLKRLCLSWLEFNPDLSYLKYVNIYFFTICFIETNNFKDAYCKAFSVLILLKKHLANVLRWNSWKEDLLLFTYLITLCKDVTFLLITKFKTNKYLSYLSVNRILN